MDDMDIAIMRGKVGWKDSICDLSRLSIATYDNLQILYENMRKVVQDAKKEKILFIKLQLLGVCGRGHYQIRYDTYVVVGWMMMMDLYVCMYELHYAEMTMTMTGTRGDTENTWVYMIELPYTTSFKARVTLMIPPNLDLR